MERIIETSRTLNIRSHTLLDFCPLEVEKIHLRRIPEGRTGNLQIGPRITCRLLYKYELTQLSSLVGAS